MSKIDEMIAELCPDGVEFHPLEDVFDMRNGYTPSKKIPAFWESGDVNWFRMEDIRENGRVLNESIQKVSLSGIKGGKLFAPDSLIVATSATIGEHALVTVPFMCNQRFTCLTRKPHFEQKIDMRFMLHYADILDAFCLENTNQGGFASVSMPSFKKFEIPVPPLEVQREIVRILDSFTKLEAELEAELEARKLQYAHYRDELLSKESLEALDGKPVEMKRLGDVANVRGRIGFRGYKKTDQVKPGQGAISVTPGNIEDGYLSFESNTYITWDKYEESPEIKLCSGDVLLVKTGSTVGKVSQVVELPEKATINPQMVVLKNILCSKRFLMYSLQSYRLQRQITTGAGVGSVPNISQEKIEKLQLAVPSLETQQKVVDILDRFDALTTSLTDGLPAEIKARRQQYEYYRDRLLDFPRKGVDAA